MTQKIQKFYRVSEVVQLLGVSQTTVYRMVTEGRLTLVKVGKRASAVPADSLREFMDKASTSADVPQGAEAAQWNALTDEDRQAAFESLPDMLDGFLKKWGWLHFAKEIERRCREKNTAQSGDKS